MILAPEHTICTRSTVMYHVIWPSSLCTKTWPLDTELDSIQSTYSPPLSLLFCSPQQQPFISPFSFAPIHHPPYYHTSQWLFSYHCFNTNNKVIRVVEIPKTEDVKRPYIRQLLSKGLKFPLPHRISKLPGKKIFAAQRPSTW